ncbi:hypothetical protein AC1031_005526 [Aphanomyces cochlioides]|nr:hypothetical protein AC1031_005526 [Aphanomyces cochlioides]
MKLAIVSAVLAIAASVNQVFAANLCNAVQPTSYVNAANQYPQLRTALNALKANPVATWYTDLGTNQVAQTLAACKNAVPTIVVYGLPNKDCGAGGFFNGGNNKNTQQYTAWIQSLVNQVGKQEVIYVLEPDAVGLTSTGGCGVTNGYQNNLKIALGLLSTNPNAHIYVDVAAWASQSQAINILNDLKKAGLCQDLRSNSFIVVTPTTTTTASFVPNLNVISLLSSPHRGPPSARTWLTDGGVDFASRTIALTRTLHCQAPVVMSIYDSSTTGNPLVDYYLWIKVPGECDGQCTGQSADAMIGPAAGAFF